jgi:hypothetical protein
MSKTSIAKQRLVLLSLLIPILAVAFAAYSVSPLDPEPGGGYWVLSPIQDCGAGLTCVIWEFSDMDLPSDPPCCIRQDLVASGNYAVCLSSFRHLH